MLVYSFDIWLKWFTFTNMPDILTVESTVTAVHSVVQFLTSRTRNIEMCVAYVTLV
jgi:hypothetical protein